MKGKTLIAYFSAEGNTAAVAKTMADAIGADLFEIKPVTPYSSADLNWMNNKSRSSVEMADETSRPQIAEKTDVSKYDNVLIGFPIWWYVEPRIVDAFIESYDFSGKTIIPFATSGGSGIEKSVSRMRKLYPDYNIADGKLLHRSNAAAWCKTL